jgi:hypothetical protein
MYISALIGIDPSAVVKWLYYRCMHADKMKHQAYEALVRRPLPDLSKQAAAAASRAEYGAFLSGND